MRWFVIYCHPDPASYSAALRGQALAALHARGDEVRLVDLYAEGFDPVFSREDKADYLPRSQILIEKVMPHAECLAWAQGLLFVFPTWFYGPPAMLKGWFERVWLPGVAFGVPDKPGGTAKPRLQHIEKLVVITTSGSPWWWLRLIRDPCRNFFKRGLRALFAKRCKTLYLQLHEMNTNSQATREAFLRKVRKRLEKL